MPVVSEVAAFSGSADTGAKEASAAMVIQEAYRMYRHRQLVKVCMPIPLCSPFLLPSLAQSYVYGHWQPRSTRLPNFVQWLSVFADAVAVQDAVASCKPAVADNLQQVDSKG